LTFTGTARSLKHLLDHLVGEVAERALRLGIDDAISPESAADAVVTLFLDGARGTGRPRSRTGAGMRAPP
jgi:hypothetical protein